MKLYYTPLSHFSRKVRLFLEYYQLDCEYVDIGSVTQTELQKFAANPLLAVPVLEDEDVWVIDSQNIIYYILEKFRLPDDLKFSSKKIHDLNFRAIVDGIMSNEVKIIQGTRSGIQIYDFNYFKKAKISIEESLKWLEQRMYQFNTEQLTFDLIVLVCALEHIEYFQTISLEKFPKLKQVVSNVSQNPLLHKTSPFVLKPIQK